VRRKRPKRCRVVGEAVLIKLDRVACFERETAPCRCRYSVDRLAVDTPDAVNAEIAGRQRFDDRAYRLLKNPGPAAAAAFEMASPQTFHC